jgi:peptidyl-prolyl cis-trans isomerase B (cyclophilin B)
MANPHVLLTTALGEILIELFAEQAPKTVENFLAYVDDGFYDGLIFHRVIANFMIQGGGMNMRMQEKETRAPVENEAKPEVKNLRGTVAMARTSDPHSATAQFFINVVDNPFLDFKEPTVQGYGYAVFGRVVEGLETVDTIRKVRTRNVGPHGDVPVDPITIITAARFEV